ncbi:indole-3-glycerol phosphate synthase TrpC [Candidatus Omnitrophota bacterium]
MILDEIIAQKKKEVAEAKSGISQEELIERIADGRQPQRNFKRAITQSEQISLIGEIKKASPSKGILRPDFQPLEIAREYQSAGTGALSILTDQKFFQGELSYLERIRQIVTLPLLRKDFIIDEYQIYRSLFHGADAVLLIAGILSSEQLSYFHSLCAQLNLDAVCEVHDQQDLEKVLSAGCLIVGINNRNLNDFSEDLKVTERLIKMIPRGKVVISESAIKSRADVKYLQGLGIDAVLIGEAFMRSQNITASVRKLMGR